MCRSCDLARRHRRVIRRATPTHRATSRTTKPPEALSADAAAARGSRCRLVTLVCGARASTTARGLRALLPSATRARTHLDHAPCASVPRPRRVCDSPTRPRSVHGSPCRVASRAAGRATAQRSCTERPAFEARAVHANRAAEPRAATPRATRRGERALRDVDLGRVHATCDGGRRYRR